MADVRIEKHGKLPVAYLSGEVTSADAADVNDALREFVEGPTGRLAIDLSQLKMIDSSGLAALINLVNRARLSGGRVVLVAPSPFVASVFSVTRLDTWFDIVPTIDQAVSHLA